MSGRNTRVIRVHKDLLTKLSRYRRDNEPWGNAIENVLNETGSTTLWSLPSLVFDTKQKASQTALELAVKQGLDYDDRELPIKLKRIKV